MTTLLFSLAIFLCISYSTIPINGNFLSRINYISSSIGEEIRFRKSSFEQYRNQMQTILETSLARFREEQVTLAKEAQHELSGYREQFREFYAEVMTVIKKQQDKVKEVESKKYTQSSKIDESLEAFKKFYDEAVGQTFTNKTSKWTFSEARTPEEPFHVRLENLNNRFAASMAALKQLSEEKTKTAERFTEKAVNDLIRMQEEMFRNASAIESSIFEGLGMGGSSTKAEVRRMRDRVEKQLHRLELEGNTWVEERTQRLEASLRSLRQAMQDREQLVEELLGRRSIDQQQLAKNDATLKRVLDMIDPKAEGWKLISSDDGFDVYRKFMQPGSMGAQFACVKCSGVINAPVNKVFSLFEDFTRMKEYNTLFDSSRDLAIVGENTKVVWTCSTPIFPFRARDFCTVVHLRRLKDGTCIVLNRATEHPAAPKTSGYVRGAVVLGANIVQPVAGAPDKCKLTMITQVDPGGFAPPVIINKLCTNGPVGFMKNVGVAAHRKPSPKVLLEKKRISAADSAAAVAAAAAASTTVAAASASGSPKGRQEGSNGGFVGNVRHRGNAGVVELGDLNVENRRQGHPSFTGTASLRNWWRSQQ